MNSITEAAPVVNYPQDRYEIRYEPASGLFACLYGGEVFDRAANYGDGDLQCGYHWTAQQALEAATPTLTYAVSCTGRQIIINTSDGQRAFAPRTDKGWATVDRKRVKLQALGYVEVTR